MASETIKEFLVGIGFDVDDKGLDAFGAKVKKFSVGVAAAVATAAAGFYALSKAVGSTAQKFDDLGDAANRIGTGTYELERFAYQAELSGSNMATATSSLENFARRVGEVAQGTGRAVAIFDELGISVQGADGEMRNATDLISEVGVKIKDLSRVEQLNILNKLGIDATLLDTLTTDVSALGAEFDALYKANGTNIQATAESAAEFNDMVFRLKYAFSSFKDALFSEVLAPLADTAFSVTKRLTEFMQVALKAMRPFFKNVANIIGALVKIFARVWVGVTNLVANIVKPFKWFFGLMPGWVKVIGGLTLAFYGLSAAFAASPVGVIVALGVAIAALVDDFLVWKEGGQSFLDWSIWEQAINAASAGIESFTQFFRDLFSAVYAVIGIIKDLFTLNFEGVFENWRVFVNSLSSAVESLFGWFSSLKDFLGGLTGGVGSLIKTGLNKAGVHAFDEWLPGGNPKVLADVKTGGGTSNNVQVKSNIIVQGTSDPERTANLVAQKEGGVINNAVRYSTPKAQ